MANRFQFKRATAANWTSANPTLAAGEPGYETDTGKFKIGDGSTAWTSLGYTSNVTEQGDGRIYVDTSMPSNADTGRMWMDTGNNYLYYADGTTYQKIEQNEGDARIYVDTSQPADSTEGKVWWDTTNEKLYYGTGSGYSEIQTGGGSETDYTAGEAISLHDVLYVDTSGNAKIADRTDSSALAVIGIAEASASSAASVTAVKSGLTEGWTGLSTGSTYYLDTSGGYTTEGGLNRYCYKVKLGVAKSDTTMDVDIGPPQETTYVDSAPIGAVMDYTGVSLPAGWNWVPRTATTVSKAQYSALWEAFGERDLFAATSGDTSTTEFHLPLIDDAYVRGGFHGAIDSVDTANNEITISDQAGDTQDSDFLRDGSPVRFFGDDLPAGLSEYTTYYVTWDSGNSGWKLWDNEESAVADAATGGGSQISLTDSGTGTQIATQFGINLEDAMQQITGEIGGLRASSPFQNAGAFTTNAKSAVLAGAGGEFRGVDFNSANSPNARTTNETRGKTSYGTKIIKTSHVLPTGEAVTATLYDTGWVSNSDWTNAELTATHGLGANLSELIVELYLSSDGTDANAIQGTSNATAAGSYGLSIEQVNTNSVLLQTGAGGVLYIDSSGVGQILDTESWYYRIVVYKPEILSTAKHGAVRSVSGGDWTIGDTDANIFLVTTGASDRTITLPTAADNPGREITVKKVDSGAGIVTIDGEGAETIDGYASVDFEVQYSGVKLVCDGSEWHVLSAIGCELVEISSALEAVYTKAFTGTTTAGAAQTDIAHGVTSSQIISISAAVYSSGLSKYLTEDNGALSTSNTSAYYVMYGATNIELYCNTAARGQAYRVKMTYWI